MRYAAFIVGFVALTAPAHAEPRSAYVTMVLQAFAAKVECPGTDVAYQDLVQKAQDMHLPDETTEKVRKAIAYMHTGGKMGERQDDELMSEVAMATRSTDLDQKRLGMTTWCETQKPGWPGLFARRTNFGAAALACETFRASRASWPGPRHIVHSSNAPFATWPAAGTAIDYRQRTMTCDGSLVAGIWSADFFS